MEYVTSYTNNAGTVTVTSLTPKATEPVVVELDAAGYGYLTEDLLTKVPTGYTVKKLGAGNVTGTNTDLGCEIEKSSSAITKYVLVEPKPVQLRSSVVRAPPSPLMSCSTPMRLPWELLPKRRV